MLSKTNVVALVEGIFTCILMSSLNFLILNYVQNPPYNLAPFSIGIFMVIFGLTGGLVGQIFLSRVSDKIAAKDPVRRLPIQPVYWCQKDLSSPSSARRLARVSGVAFIPRIIWAGSPGKTNRTEYTVIETRKSSISNVINFLIR